MRIILAIIVALALIAIAEEARPTPKQACNPEIMSCSY